MYRVILTTMYLPDKIMMNPETVFSKDVNCICKAHMKLGEKHMTTKGKRQHNGISYGYTSISSQYYIHKGSQKSEVLRPYNERSKPHV